MELTHSQKTRYTFDASGEGQDLDRFINQFNERPRLKPSELAQNC